MRLTLRTLLAYLDNTLEPQDAATLRQKVAESGFATQLVERIKESLTASLPAPSPEAVGPVDESNVISEYLDSTLPSEQVAEVEKACLESGPHLAEAAACHQLLTMVLGNSADVSDELRQRIYELPDTELKNIATAPTFSGLSIPADRPSPLDARPEDLETADASPLISEPVTPVGVNDSGVSDAPTRLREAEAVAAAMGHKLPPRHLESSIYGGSIRPSRVAPWLVSLALVAALAFAVVQIFKPLIWPNQTVARQDDTTDVIGDEPSETTPLPATSSDEDGTDESDPSTGLNVDVDESDSVPPPTPRATTGTDANDTSTDTDTTNAESTENSAMNEDEVDETAPPLPSTTGTSVEIPSVENSDTSVENDGAKPVADANTEEMTDTTTDVVDSSAPPIPPATEDLSNEEPVVEAVAAATLVSDTTLVAAKVGDVWEHLKKDDVISTGINVFAAPTFRAEFATDATGITLIGPTMVNWERTGGDSPTLRIEDGQLIVQSNGTASQIDVQLHSLPITIKLADEMSAVAISVQHYRAPGLDPLIAENRRLLAGVLMLSGSAELTFEGQPSALVAGQQWTKKGSAEPQLAAVEAIPNWATSEGLDSLIEEAQEGLLGLIEDAEPLEIELREARLFRRAEVGALAAKTLLGMGYGDIYFGGDGILSDAKQRSYWFEHFDALQRALNRDEQTALKLRAAIVEMDSANALPLFRLLTGFSQTQLIEGGDEELVGLLDSPSMSVRVLALENLEAITGTTLYFKPDQDNAVRREPGIKKWIVRQRKGDIRWQE